MFKNKMPDLRPETSFKGSPPIHICFLADASNTHVRRWLGWFVRQGYQVSCLTDKAAVLEGVRIFELPTRESLGQGKDTYIRLIDILEVRTRKAKRFLQEIKPDILHAIFLHQRGWAAALTNFHPLIITLLGSDVYLPRAKTEAIRLRDLKFNHLALKAADFVTAVSQDLLKRTGVERDRSAIIPVGIDCEAFINPPDVERLAYYRQKFTLTPDNVLIFSPRAIAPLYNTQVIVEAIPKVLALCPKAVFLLKDTQSDTDERRSYLAQIQESVRRLGVEHAVRWETFVPYEDLPVLYALADVVVSIPSSDALPVTLLEAMTSGTPVVAGDLPAYDGFVTHGVTGLRVNSQNSGEVAEALLSVLRNSALKTLLIQEARQKALEVGDFEAHMRTLEAHYRRLCLRPRNILQKWIDRLKCWWFRFEVHKSKQNC